MVFLPADSTNLGSISRGISDHLTSYFTKAIFPLLPILYLPLPKGIPLLKALKIGAMERSFGNCFLSLTKDADANPNPHLK